LIVIPALLLVIPAKAGIHLAASLCSTLDPGFRRDDGVGSKEFSFSDILRR
jgi:hypothetical protein